jgi:hypothetical protein
MKEATSQILKQIKIVIFIYMIICVVQMFSLGTAPMELLKASLVSFAMVVLAITAKNFVKHPNLPGFAWATLISFVLTLPVSPLSDFIVGTVGKFNLVGLPLLAFAGISVGEQLGVLKKLSWKIVLISFLVMASTYWGSALISQVVMSLNGTI